MVGMAVRLPFIVFLSFSTDSLFLYSCPSLIYAFFTRCSWGCHSVSLSSSCRAFQLPGLSSSVWTDQPQILHESLSENSGNCSLLSLKCKEKNGVKPCNQFIYFFFLLKTLPTVYIQHTYYIQNIEAGVV